MFYVVLLCLALFAGPVRSSYDDKACEASQPVVSSFDVGDYRHCLSQLNRGVYVFEVLPIYGFDNLRNEDMGMVIAPNYSKCKLTEDGKFLLPDDVYLIPLKQSKLHEFAELITHWHNYSSATSKSVNVDAGLNLGHFGISGKYANDYLNTKSKQVMDRSFSTRVQLRYIAYRAKLQPAAALHPKFKSALIKIARFLQMNDTFNARYESEMLIRDYGTHVVTSMDAGAAIVQEDFISKKLVMQDETTKRDILATASANFFSLAHMGVTYKTSTSQEMSDSYEKSKTSSDIKTYGGSIFMFANYTVTDWAQKLDNNLVAMDRSGDPLYYLIHKENLPEVPQSLVRQVSVYVKNAIKDYYEYNTYRGCMNVDSPNFSFQANVDDGNCKLPLTNMTFGGVYQTCEMQPGYTAGDLCGSSREANPKTGTYSCPPGYSTIELHTNVFTQSYSSHKCHSCWIVAKCCHDEYHSSTAHVTTYWCAAEGPIPQDSGYLFGGMYSTKIDNPLSQRKSCPEAFYARKFGSDLHICVSDDFEEGLKSSLPFAGFYSCTMGNPLAMKNSDVTNANSNSLKAYYSNEGSAGWPKKCPDGYSGHLAIIDQGCAIHYCIVAGALSAKGLPPIRRPPFSVEVPFIQLITPEYEYSIQNGTWNIISSATSDVSPSQKSKDGDNASISAGVASTISIFVTLVCIGFIMALVVFTKRKRQSSQTGYGEIESEAALATQSEFNYGGATNQVTA